MQLRAHHIISYPYETICMYTKVYHTDMHFMHGVSTCDNTDVL